MIKYCPECGTKFNKDRNADSAYIECIAAECSYIHWDNPVPVVAALVKHNGQYLIARNALWPINIYSVITGYLEAKEEVESAVLREVKEELNLDGKITNYLGNYTFVEKNQLIIAYEVEARGELKTNHEIADTRYLTPDELAVYDFQPLYITKNIINRWSKLAGVNK